MKLTGQFQTTAVGSFPHKEGVAISERLAALIDIPCWPQLPRRDFRESMYIQYSAGLPAIKIDQVNEKITFDTTGDLSDDLERFYSHYLADDLDAFALLPEYAVGFFDMLEVLESTSGDWAKGQVTGPISFGLTVTDQDLRASLYNDLLADAIVKNMACNARWQIQQLKTVRPNALMFVDEPYMAAFGSAFISLGREQAVTILNEVFAAIHQEDALAGVHCCANTDWSLLLATSVDVLNLDAYGYLDNLALYPAELRSFLDRGGLIAWGIVPNNGDIMSQTAETLARRLRQGLTLVADKAQARGIEITAEELGAQSLITTSCGLGPATVPIAERAMETLARMGSLLQPGRQRQVAR
jgi:methionine synthase II (cobalamin-independent)